MILAGKFTGWWPACCRMTGGALAVTIYDQA
jgi:hypothetical protein